MRPGFTLVEVAVVLLVMMLATAVTVPRLLDDSRDGLANSTDAMTRLLLDARITAARTARPVTFTIDPKGRRYWTESTTLSRSDTLPISADVVLLSLRPRLRIRFDAQGSAFGDTVHLRSEGRTRSIAIDAWSGAVHAR
ncbi:MAG: hypothetical protein WEE89_07650 [Gemmatimonadota bacterium]